jgi:tetratricopeptide (TPR) repeat protein
MLDRVASRRVKLSEVSLQLALAQSHLGHLQAARDAIGTATDQTQLDGAWLAQFGRIARLSGRSDVAEEAFERSLAFAPTAERVACRGEARIDYPDAASVALVPQIEPWRALCLDALGTERP